MKNRLLSTVLTLCMLGSGAAVWAQDVEEDYLLEETEKEFRHGLIDSEASVEVVSRRSELAREAMAVVSVINRREIELFGANNLYEVIDRLVGTYSLGTMLFSQNQISMRGDVNGNFSNRIAILLNGRPTWGSATEGVDYVLLLSLPLDIVERIEVHRGPGSMYHGSSAFIGAINIVTKRPSERQEATASAGGGSFESRYASLAGGLSNIGGKQNPSRGERISFYGGLRWYDEEGFTDTIHIPRQFGGDSLTYNIFNRGRGAFAELDFKGLRINAMYGKSIITTLDDPQVGGLRTDDMEGEKLYLNAGYFHRFNESWTVNLNAGYIHDSASLTYLEDYSSGGQPVTGDLEFIDSEDFIFEGNLNGSLVEILRFTIGSEVKRISGGKARYSYLKSYDEWLVRGYMDARYSLLGYLHLFAGLQFQDFESVDTEVLTPRFGAMIDILPSTSLKILYGYATRDPSKIESNLVFTSSDLSVKRAERIRTFEAQLSSRFEDLHFSATYFYSRYLDQIIPIAEDEFFFGWINDDKDMTTLGFELELQYAVISNLYLTGSYSYVENRRETDEPGVFAIGFSHAPTYFAKGGIAWFKPQRYSFGLYSSYYSKPREIRPDDPLTAVNPVPEGYHWITLNANWFADDNLKLGLYITNLADEYVRWPDTANELLKSIPGKGGRAAYLTLTMRLGDFY